MKRDKITPEEKELLRQLMENDDLCRKWDFFAGAGLDRPVPPPEYFMREKPKPPGLITQIKMMFESKKRRR